MVVETSYVNIWVMISLSLVDASLPLRENCCFHLQNKVPTDGKFVD
jgi:hypothetical protein